MRCWSACWRRTSERRHHAPRRFAHEAATTTKRHGTGLNPARVLPARNAESVRLGGSDAESVRLGGSARATRGKTLSVGEAVSGSLDSELKQPEYKRLVPLIESNKHAARALLRSLLREATYLPDSRARSYIASHVRQRFRASTAKSWERRKDPEALELWIRAQQKEARNEVSQLRRANEGEIQMVRKVLSLTYGRIGRRRRELMQQLMPTAPAVDEQAPDDEVKVTPNQLSTQALRRVKGLEGKEAGRERTPTVLDLSPQLKALLQSQSQARPSNDTRPNPRTLTPVIPEFNAWMQPMPQKRVKNIVKRWNAGMLDRALPPLPTAEWELLRDLATGKLRFEGPVPRRPRAGSETVQVSALELTLFKKPNVRRFAEPTAHTLTSRFMRRAWVKVFSQCPLMTWDREKGRWDVTWGHHVLHAFDGTTGVRPGNGKKATEEKI